MSEPGRTRSTFVYAVAASLDGYIATPDGGVDWLPPFEPGGEDYGYGAFMASLDAAVMGRATYDVARALGPWPYTLPTWVLTGRPLPGPPPGVVASGLEPSALADAFAAEGVRRVWLVGGGRLAASFRDAGLLAEVDVAFVPVLLGAGVPLFAPGEGPVRPLRRTHVQAYPNGMVQVKYALDPEA